MCNVLIASPNRNDHRFLKKILARHFINVVMLPDATTPKEALEVAQMETPEILILDIGTSSEHAFYYVTEIFKLHPNVKVIFIDDHESFKNAQAAVRFGAIDYLVLPLLEDECTSSIHRSILSLNQVSLLNYETQHITDNRKESVNQMTQYLHEHYQEEINLETLANFMHLNKNYVSRVFKQTIGMSFVVYLTHYRMEQAKKLLRTSEYSITEVAERIGYTDLAYFSRIFKKETSYTPNQYKQIFHGDYNPADLAFVGKM